MLRALVLIPVSAIVSYCLGFGLSKDWSEEDNTIKPVSQDKSTKGNLSNQATKDSKAPHSPTIAIPQSLSVPLFSRSQSQLPTSNAQPNQLAIKPPTVTPPKLTQIQPPPPTAPVSPSQVVKTLPIDNIVARSIGGDVKTIPADNIRNNLETVSTQSQTEVIPTDNANQNSVEVSTQSRTETLPTFTQSPPVALTPASVTAQPEIPDPAIVKVNKQAKPKVVANNSSNRREDAREQLVADANLARTTLSDLLPLEEVVPPPATPQLKQTLPEPESTEIVPPPSLPESTQTQPFPAPNEPITAPTVPTVEPLSRGVDETYTLGAGDLISINIFRVPEFSGEQQVSVDGSLNLPLVGKLTVEAMTLEQAGAAIASKYQPELRSPAVTVSLLQPRPLQIAISGEIKQPGSYVLPLINNAQFPSLAQAVQVAGGMTQAADLERVQIQRSQPSGFTQTITLNLWELLQAGDLSQDLTLRDGDVIIIPATTEVNPRETAQLAASNLASISESSDVAVVGEVFRPGAYRLAGGENGASRPTVSQAIQSAGGIKPSANVRQIQVRRPTRNGTEQNININLWQLLQEGDLSQDLTLQEGDTIIIPTATEITASEAAQIASTNLSPNVIRVNVGGEVEQPGTVEVPSNTTLNEALLAVGGFNERAEETVELIRFNPDGSLTRREIEVDLNQGIDSQTNPLLWQNDVIIAGPSRSSRITDTISNILAPLMQILPPLRLLF